MTARLRRLGQVLISLLFPTRCVLCGGIIKADREEICPECAAELKRPTAEMSVDFTEGVACAVLYEGAVRAAFLRYKFSGQSWLAEVFGELLAEAVADKLDGRFDAITYPPLSAKRLKKRGYDQARLLAEQVGQRLGYPVIASLRKVRNTVSNSSMTGEDAKQQRAENVSGVYEALAGIEGRRLLLIDDILTTGSTMSECAKTLLLGGAESVVCAAFGRADKGDA